MVTLAPGSPSRQVESFDRGVGDELLNGMLILSLVQAHVVTAAWTNGH